jgi:hypothetical protein
MNYSLFSRIRDCLLLCALFLLLKTAYERNYTFLSAHKQSIIHELDRDFIDHIYTVQRHVHFLQEHPVYGDRFAHAIADIKERLTSIEEKYLKNSPGLALLGPIGTVAIVTKEEMLQQKLLAVANDISKILYSSNGIQEEFKHAHTIHDALNINKKLIGQHR